MQTVYGLFFFYASTKYDREEQTEQYVLTAAPASDLLYSEPAEPSAFTSLL